VTTNARTPILLLTVRERIGTRNDEFSPDE
jgi:hypothetical protein